MSVCCLDAHGLQLPAILDGERQVDNVTDWDVLSKMIDDLVEHVKSLDHDELKRAAAAMA